MTCPRCQGLILDEWGDIRCLICGHRVIVRTQAPIARRDWDRRVVWTKARRRNLREKQRLAWRRRKRLAA